MSVRGFHFYPFNLLSESKKNYAVKSRVWGKSEARHPKCEEAIAPGKTIFLVMVSVRRLLD